ncbi:hypothetical protein ACF1G5_03065 [Streptomyces coeruleorubidus]|uniref:hypothetical protein n=1 Tax=Streptomyces coeruleorubidus TaxID=116188 RepID=UPI0036F8164C
METDRGPILRTELQRELNYDGLRAAEAKGSKGGRRPAVAAAKTVTLDMPGKVADFLRATEMGDAEPAAPTTA